MKTTREGRRFVLASLLIAVAAVNTGNNLIYLILALMLSLLVLAVLILRINLWRLTLDARPVSAVFVGEEAAFSISVRNGKRLVPSYSLNIAAEGLIKRVYILSVPARGEAATDARAVFRRRGLYGSGDFAIGSGFPFILFASNRNVRVSREVLVYPALIDVEEIVPEVRGIEEGEAMRMTGAGEEIYSLRDFRYGDDWRRIHWKASAKAADLMVKEYAEQEMKKTTIFFDNLGVPPIQKKDAYDEVFEKAVSLAASLSRYFIDSGHLVRVVSARKVIPFGSGDEHLFKILDILALVGEERRWESPMPSEGEGALISVVRSSRPAGVLPLTPDLVVHAETL